MESCIFCKIVKKEIKSFLVDENEKFIAILDIYPITKGQTLVIPKEHYSANPLEVPDEILKEAISFSKQVAKKLVEKLGAKRVFFVIEGMEIDHLHIKLYPFYKISSNILPTESMSLELGSYPGFLITLHGPRAKDEELEEISKKLRT